MAENHQDDYRIYMAMKKSQMVQDNAFQQHSPKIGVSMVMVRVGVESSRLMVKVKAQCLCLSVQCLVFKVRVYYFQLQGYMMTMVSGFGLEKGYGLGLEVTG